MHMPVLLSRQEILPWLLCGTWLTTSFRLNILVYSIFKSKDKREKSNEDSRTVHTIEWILKFNNFNSESEWTKNSATYLVHNVLHNYTIESTVTLLSA
jgi:hypothetical protein